MDGQSLSTKHTVEISFEVFIKLAQTSTQETKWDLRHSYAICFPHQVLTSSFLKVSFQKELTCTS